MQNEKSQGIYREENVNMEVVSAITGAEEIRFNGFTRAVHVTPEMAETFLKHNTMNRTISDSVNLRYAQAMQAGHWGFNGETIVFSDKGILLDGQNRLKAIVRSGVTIPILVVYGIDESNFKTMDQGSKRTTGQILKIMNCKNNNTLAATLRLAYIYLYIDSKMAKTSSDSIYHQVLLNLLVRYPKIKESVRKGRTVGHLCNGTIAAFCHFIFSLQNQEEADLFIRQVSVGVELPLGAPALALRDYLILSKGETPKPDSRTLIALFFMAWNYFRIGKKVRALKWHDTDEFPEVI